MALPPGFLEEVRARTPLNTLIGRRVKLARSGRQWKGCCPFHGERTPSFYVYDDHFHCFGCGAHGDAISFVMQTQGSGFMEAVEQLAGEAGLEVPRPASGEDGRRRPDLHAVLDAAEAFFRARLRAPEGERARAYLRGRGITEALIDGFGLGWSGDGRGGLLADLRRQGVEPALLGEAGLLRTADEAGRDAPPRELFFGRVMFPIRDRRGRVVSFGGRILGDGQPKYLNGPETALFAKRRTLYGLDRAGEAVRRGARLVVVEGYIDVIALAGAGFAGAVAPLGTALTQEQLEALWRLSPAPVLCFDGDPAGARAAARATEVALPLIAPDRSLCLAMLPHGEDPDTLVRRSGARAFQAVLDGARPLSAALYDLLCEGQPQETPEQRAALLTRLMAASERIADKRLASEYRSLLRSRFYEGRGSRGGRPPKAKAPARRPVVTSEEVAAERLRNLVAIVLRHPALLDTVDDAFCEFDLPPFLLRVRDATRAWAHEADKLDSAALIAHLHSVGLEEEVARALASEPMPHPPCAAPDALPGDALAGWWELLGHVNRPRLRSELAAAEALCRTELSQANQQRVIALKQAYDRVCGGELAEETDA